MHLDRFPFVRLTVIAGLAAASTRAQSGADDAARRPSARPPDSQPAQRAPAVGEAAPDFTLKSRDGKQEITRSKFQADRPLVLIFGSFT